MIHTYSLNGYNIVIDANSGAISVLDDIAFDVVNLYKENSFLEIEKKLLEKYDKESIKEAYEEVLELVKSDMLFSEDIYEEYVPLVNEREPVVKALCLHVAHDCNLRCKYCFAEEGEYQGKRSLMSFEVGKAAIDFIIKNSNLRKNLEIDFFGGEPLMNFDVVKQIVEYGREQEKLYNKNFRFTMTTNGVLLDNEKLEYINKHMYNLVLSLDGRKEVNDNMRKTLNKKGSYDIITPKFVEAANSRNQLNYYVRGTFTKENLDFSKDVIHLNDLGFKQISIEPVVAPENESYAITYNDLDRIYKEYEGLAIKIIERKEKGEDFNFFHFMIDLTGGPCVAKRLVGCGAATEYLAVTPEGDLYPCHQFVGKGEFKLGSVYEGLNDFTTREIFEKSNIYSKEGCKNCFVKFYCSGGCAANSYNENGDINKPYEIGCLLQRKRVECAVMIKVHEAFLGEING